MANEVILFPDATVLFVNLIRDEMAERGYTDLIVGTRVPNPRPDTFVQVNRTGGVQHSFVVDQTQLTIECWALLEEDAQDMAQLIRSIVNAARGTVIYGVPIYNVGNITGPGSLPSGLVFVPDRLSAQARFSFTMVVSTRGVAE